MENIETKLEAIMDQVDEILVPIEQTHIQEKYRLLTGKLVELYILAELSDSDVDVEAEISFVEVKLKELLGLMKVFQKICA